MATAAELIQIEIGPRQPAPKPEWLKARAPVGENYHNLKTLARKLELHTVCESAHCPNIGECWNHHTATFMLLGNLCTRRCGFCAVPKGRPQPIDYGEPARVAEAVEKLALKFAVVTSVNRDDDNVGGARVFAMTIAEIRKRVDGCRVEVLIPDFQGLDEPLRIVMDARPDILNHNTETVPRLYRVARSGARYERTLRLLERAKEMDPAIPTKTGVMVGLGESTDELLEVFRRPRSSQCGHPHHRPVLAAVQGPFAGGAALYARRVPLPEGRIAEDGVPPRGVRSAGALELSRPRTGRCGNHCTANTFHLASVICPH